MAMISSTGTTSWFFIPICGSGSGGGGVMKCGVHKCVGLEVSIPSIPISIHHPAKEGAPKPAWKESAQSPHTRTDAPRRR